MQREIKFRAWDGHRMFVPDGLKNPVNFTANVQHMQFTGLKDKNGKEIYEGDVVRVENGTIGEIFWLNGPIHHGWHNRINGIPFGMKDADFLLEIIGNIYENPELLK